jgi:hypothetical protein
MTLPVARSATALERWLRLRRERKNPSRRSTCKPLRDSLVTALPTEGGPHTAGVLLTAEAGAGSLAQLTAINSTLAAYGTGAAAGLLLESASASTATAQLANTIAMPQIPRVL